MKRSLLCVTCLVFLFSCSILSDPERPASLEDALAQWKEQNHVAFVELAGTGVVTASYTFITDAQGDSYWRPNTVAWAMYREVNGECYAKFVNPYYDNPDKGWYVER